MKNLQLIVLCFLCTTGLFAQRDNSLFNTSGRFGVFGAPIWEYSNLSINGDVAKGGGAALVLGNAFIGAYGSGDLDWNQVIEGERVNISSGHGGLWLGYVPFQSSVIHPYISTRIGWGAADIEFTDDNFTSSETFFVLTPEAGLEVNVFRWFRVAGTVGYKWYSGLDDVPQIGNWDTDNLHAGLALRFGLFGKDKNRRKNCRKRREVTLRMPW